MKKLLLTGMVVSVALWGCDSRDKPDPKASAATESKVDGPAPGSSEAIALAAIHLCDKLGAHPDDPEAVAAGVGDEALDAAEVVRACNAAVAFDKETPRLRFQAARGLLKAGQAEEAVDLLISASEAGHGGALAYLADLLMDGIAGLDADPARAKALYERAAESGFEPAKKILAEFQDQTAPLEQAEKEEKAMMARAAPAPASAGAASSPPAPSARSAAGDPKNLNEPEIVGRIVKRDFDGITFNESWVKSYLVNMLEETHEACEKRPMPQRELMTLKAAADAPPIDPMALGTGAALMELFRGNVTVLETMRDPNEIARMAKREKENEKAPIDALKDAYALMARHPCGSAGLTAFNKNARDFINNAGAPFAPTRQIFETCVREAKPARYQPGDYCTCWVGALRTAAMSRAQRKALSAPGQFLTTSEAITKRNRVAFRMCTGELAR